MDRSGHRESCIAKQSYPVPGAVLATVQPAQRDGMPESLSSPFNDRSPGETEESLPLEGLTGEYGIFQSEYTVKTASTFDVFYPQDAYHI